jgi:hypothetical protein
MRRLPDAATLDALVLGTAGANDADAWEALVLEPGGAEAWDKAVARRRRMDALAYAARSGAWLSRVLRGVLRTARRARSVPTIELFVDFPDAPLDGLVGATLGPAEEDLRAAEPRLVWGQIVPVQVRLGELVALRTSSDAQLDVRYLSAGQEGPLPTRTWKLEPGEAPVLLVALVGGDTQAPVAQALATATAVAGLLILEAAANGETSG